MPVRGQSSLEYLILIAAVIAIASISVVMLSGSSSSSTRSLDISTCKQAATECALAKAVSPIDTCTKCETACSGSSGELFAGAINLCKAGNSSAITTGASSIEGCTAGVACTTSGGCAGTRACVDGVLGQCVVTSPEGCPEKCASGAQKACTSGVCTGVMTCDSLGQWSECNIPAGGCPGPSLTNMMEPADPATYSASRNYVFNVTVADASLSRVWYSWNGVNTTVTSASNVYVFTKTGLQAGTYNYVWYANNSNGVTSSASGGYTVNAPATAAPVIVSSRISPDPANSTQQLTGWCNATDSDSSISGYYYSWFKNGVLNASSSSSGTYSSGVEYSVSVLSAVKKNGENWIFSCRASDGTQNSSWKNDSIIIMASSKTLMYDQFNNLSLWAGNVGVGNKFGGNDDSAYWYVNTLYYYDASYSAVKLAYGTHYMNTSLSTVNYSKVNVSFWARTISLRESGEYFRVAWTNGNGTWNLLLDQSGTLNSFTKYSYALPSAAGNIPTFSLQVSCYNWHTSGNDGCAIDTLNISGSN